MSFLEKLSALQEQQDLTAEQVRDFHSKNNDGFMRFPDNPALSAYFDFTLQGISSENKENVETVRADLAIMAIEETVKGNKEFAKMYCGGLHEGDIKRGLERDPELLKRISEKGNVPDFVKEVAKQTSLAQNPDYKFLLAQDVNSDMLKEIAEKGLDAGFGVEAYLRQCNASFKEKSSAHTAWNFEQFQTNAGLDFCSNMEKRFKDGLKLDDVSKAMGIQQEDVFKMAKNKALGKDVANIAPKLEKSSKLKRFFMSKDTKKKEDTEIAQQQAKCDEINKFISEFAKKYANYPDELNKFDTLESLSTEVQKLTKQAKALETDPRRLSQESENNPHLELMGLYNQAKLSVVQQKASDVRTSAVTGVQQDLGNDNLAMKERVLAEFQAQGKTPTPRELYDATRAKGQKVLDLRMGGRKEEKPVRQTTLSREVLNSRSGGATKS